VQKGERNQTKTELHVSLVKAMRGRGVNRWIVRFFHPDGINYISILKGPALKRCSIFSLRLASPPCNDRQPLLVYEQRVEKCAVARSALPVVQRINAGNI
jgi:hypothetical protein